MLQQNLLYAIFALQHSTVITDGAGHVVSQAYAWYITWLSGYVTGTEQTHLLGTGIFQAYDQAYELTGHMPGIYQVYIPGAFF